MHIKYVPASWGSFFVDFGMSVGEFSSHIHKNVLSFHKLGIFLEENVLKGAQFGLNLCFFKELYKYFGGWNSTKNRYLN